MGAKTKIEWTRGDDGTPGATWNPVTGCDEVSPGCDHCYAKTLAERFRGTPGHYYEHGFDVQLRPDKLDLPLRWTKPKRIFVNSMSDLFHKDIPDSYVAQVFAVMALAERHTFQVLTKRHGRMRSLLSSVPFQNLVAFNIEQRLTLRSTYTHQWPLPNVWLGVSVEDQHWADTRIPVLLETPAAVRFLSMEPLLGPVSFRWAKWVPWRGAHHLDGLKGIDWVIVGGESGHGARPMHPQWARDLRDQCAEAGVAYHFKQYGDWTPISRADDPWRGKEPDAWVHERTGAVRTENEALADAGGSYAGVWRVGKKAAGRELDGRTHDEYPEVTHARA